MDLDFLEIGTSDFDTLIQNSDNNTVGICIEPLKIYLDKLPDRDGWIKINAALSDHNGTIDIFYIDPKTITELGLPWWMKGCNSVNKYHPTVLKYITDNNLDPNIISKTRVIVITFETLVIENNIKSVKMIKVDTEGHDCIILGNYLDYCKTHPSFLADIIKFESNKLTNSYEVDNIISRLTNLGYRIESHTRSDVVMTKINFTNVIPNTYLSEYPYNYNIKNLPHHNTLEGAMKWCLENNGGGITYQNNRYEVRKNQIPRLGCDINIKSWIRLVGELGN